MNYLVATEAFADDERLSPPTTKRQGKFVSFLVNAYYIEPSRRIKEERGNTSDNNSFSHLTFRDSFFSADVAEVVGRVAEEALLLDQIHVQEKPPFRLIERPLLVPAMLGSLLRRLLLCESGIFVSTTTLDNWLSLALGTRICLARHWLDADYRIQRALRTSRAGRLVEERGACETDVRAIRLQTKRGGVLYSLWDDTYQVLCAQLGDNPPSPQVAQSLISNAAEASVVLCRKVDAVLGRREPPVNDSSFTLYAAAECEICSCVTFHCFFREIETEFRQLVNSRGKRETCAAVMRNCFVGSLNAFTMNRYDVKKAAAVFSALDAIAWIADGKCLAKSHDLRTVGVHVQPGYVERAVILGCDPVYGIIKETAERAASKSLLIEKAHFSGMDTSAISLSAMYSYSRPQLAASGERVHTDDAAPPNSTAGQAGDDWTGYYNFVELTLDDAESDLATYILSAEQQAVKRRIVVDLSLHKRQRAK